MVAAMGIATLFEHALVGPCTGLEGWRFAPAPDESRVRVRLGSRTGPVIPTGLSSAPAASANSPCVVEAGCWPLWGPHRRESLHPCEMMARENPFPYIGARPSGRVTGNE
jgi:hypothetical protein